MWSTATEVAREDQINRRNTLIRKVGGDGYRGREYEDTPAGALSVTCGSGITPWAAGPVTGGAASVVEFDRYGDHHLGGSSEGVPLPVGTRWFRHAGGMKPLNLSEPARQYLTIDPVEFETITTTAAALDMTRTVT